MDQHRSRSPSSSLGTGQSGWMVIEPARQSWVAPVSRAPQMMTMVIWAQTWSVAGWTGASWMFPFHCSTVIPTGPVAPEVHTADGVHPSESDASPRQTSVGHIPPQQRRSRCCLVGLLVDTGGTRPHTGDHQSSHSSQPRPLGSLGSNEMGC